MSKTLVQLTKDDENYTPKWFVDKFGSFDYDPATVEAKAIELGIENYDTILTDGLTKDWTQYKRIWINPPFTKKKEFLTKARETYQQKKIDIYILFPIGFMTTKNFHEAMGDTAGCLYIPDGRINFQSGLGKKRSSATFGSVVLKLQDLWEVKLIKR